MESAGRLASDAEEGRPNTRIRIAEGAAVSKGGDVRRRGFRRRAEPSPSEEGAAKRRMKGASLGAAREPLPAGEGSLLRAPFSEQRTRVVDRRRLLDFIIRVVRRVQQLAQHLDRLRRRR